MGCRHLQLLAAVLSFCLSLRADTVYLNGFTTEYGLTGCLYDPTEGCYENSGNTCYIDRGHEFAITGTAPLCSACMPKDYRNIATYAVPMNLPCALWRAYDCDDWFVSYVWEKSGNNACFLGGRKSYNIENTFSSAGEAQDVFITQCRDAKSAASYGLNVNKKITEEQFCFPLRNNITDINVYGSNNRVLTVLTGYKEYYEKKYGNNTIIKSTE